MIKKQIKMDELKFKDLEFIEENNKIRVNFLKIFYFYIDKSYLEKFGKYKIKKNSIMFEKNLNKFNFFLNKGFNEIRNSISNKKTIYIHKNSGIPLIGCLYFGIVDKGSNMIEVKPITSCNINCIFCSVDEGKSSKKQVDYVVEKEYLVEELKKLIEFKNAKIDIYINPHGEPLLYADLIDLVKDISKIRNIGIVSIITNGLLLNKSIIDNLVKSGLNQINISISAISQENANKLAGTYYNVNHVLNMAEYASKKLKVVLSPVLLFGINEPEMPKIIEFGKKIGAEVLIQNFQYNKTGRNPVKDADFNKFFDYLKKLEDKYNIKLIKDYNLIKTKELPILFRKEDIIKANIVCDGRNKGEKLAVADNKVIVISNCFKEGNVKIKITKARSNLFYGECL